MDIIGRQLFRIAVNWRAKIETIIPGQEKGAKEEEQAGEIALNNAEKESKLYISRNYYVEANTHFNNARMYYIDSGNGIKANDCQVKAKKCETEAKAKKAEIDETIRLGQEEGKKGEDSFKQGEEAFRLTVTGYSLSQIRNLLTDFRQRFHAAKEHSDAATREYYKPGTPEYEQALLLAGLRDPLTKHRNLLADFPEHFRSANEHFDAAAENYHKLGTPEYDEKAGRYEMRAEDSRDEEKLIEELMAETERLIAEIEELVTEIERQYTGLIEEYLADGEHALRTGQSTFFPLTAINHYNSAKEYFLAARDLHPIIVVGNTAQEKAEDVEILIREVDHEIQFELIKSGIVILVIILIIIPIIRRHSHMQSIQREIESDKKLFRD